MKEGQGIVESLTARDRQRRDELGGWEVGERSRKRSRERKRIRGDLIPDRIERQG